MQPLARYDLDAAIIFSDILLIHHGLGYTVSYENGHPRISGAFKGGFSSEKVLAVAEAVELARSHLDRDKALIGFSGAPWTLLVYTLTSPPRPPFLEMMRLFKRKAFAESELNKFTEATIIYLGLQIKAGADAVMLFDSWAGIVPERELEKYVFIPHAQIVKQLKAEFVGVPIIGFPHGISSERLASYAVETGVDAVSVDDGTDWLLAATTVGKICAMQGNLSPLTLKLGGERLEEEVSRIKEAFAGVPHIFNLGHGILPTTPPHNVEKLLSLVRDGTR